MNLDPALPLLASPLDDSRYARQSSLFVAKTSAGAWNNTSPAPVFVALHLFREAFGMGDDVVVVDKKDLLMALGFFKDWSNFMLVTTVAALGWTAKVETNGGCRGLQLTSVVFFALSIAFAVFTLALVPLVAEEIAGGAKSMYAVEANFNVLPDAWPFNALHDWLKKDCSPF